MDTTLLTNFLNKWLNNVVGVSFQYFVITGVCFLIFFAWKRKGIWYANIQQKYPDNKHIKRELFYSCTSVLMMATLRRRDLAAAVRSAISFSSRARAAARCLSLIDDTEVPPAGLSASVVTTGWPTVRPRGWYRSYWDRRP